MSLTIIGVVGQVLVWLATFFELDVAPGEVDTALKVLAAFVTAAVAWYGRYRKGDINVLGGRK